MQFLEQRLQSATHSLQATPNSTIHSLPPLIHPPLVDLWGPEAVGYMGMPVGDGGVTVPPTEEVTTDHSPLLEAQEEEIKVRLCNGDPQMAPSDKSDSSLKT